MTRAASPLPAEARAALAAQGLSQFDACGVARLPMIRTVEGRLVPPHAALVALTNLAQAAGLNVEAHIDLEHRAYVLTLARSARTFRGQA